MQERRRFTTASRSRGRSLAALAATAVLLATGCSLLGPEEPTAPPHDPTSEAEPTPREGTLLPEGTTEVQVEAGESMQVALPEGALGVGDYWGVISVSDPAVAEADVVIGENVVGEMPRESGDEEGGPQAFAVEISGLQEGEATVRVLYCTRTREVSEGCDQEYGTLDAPVEPVEIQVSVTG